MLLFIFSSKKSLFHSLFFFFSFLSIFIFFENKIMENPGNNMIIANDPSQKEFIISETDLIILGSSRAAESIRPSLISENFTEFSEVYNFACHSCTLYENQLVPILAKLKKAEIDKVKSFIIAVEPFVFMKLKNRENILNFFSSISKEQTFFDKLNFYNRKMLKKLKKFGKNLIYSWCFSCQRQNRRQLHNWFAFLFYSSKDFFIEKNNNDFISDNYNLWIINRGVKFSRKLVFKDNGFQGMKLIRNKEKIKIENIFKEHQKFYPQHLSNFDENTLHEVEEILYDLKVRNSKIILIRLPIHKSLMQIENHYIPNFNSKIIELSNKLGLPYLNMNTEYFKDFTNNANNFTDSSHLDFEATKIFNELLINELKKYWQ